MKKHKQIEKLVRKEKIRTNIEKSVCMFIVLLFMLNFYVLNYYEREYDDKEFLSPQKEVVSNEEIKIKEYYKESKDDISYQKEERESTKDGMDIALCSIDIKNRVVNYAGAYNPLWIIRNGKTEIEEIKAPRKSIGGFTEDDQHFEGHTIQLQQGDTFYIFSDGYSDQYGGPKEKKLMRKKFKQVLIDIQNKTMQEQEKYLEEFLDTWRGDLEQIDDIVIIGIRL